MPLLFFLGLLGLNCGSLQLHRPPVDAAAPIEWLGHSTIVVTLAYAHVLPDQKEKAVQRIEDVLFGTLGGS